MDRENKGEAERLCDIVIGSMSEEVTGGDLARRAYRSRTHFYRLFRALIQETPGAFRSRLLLERAAWQLARSEALVTDIAFDAQYGSLEAFTRSFRKAFGMTPSLYRRLGPTHFWLPSPNGIHFYGPSPDSKGTSDMDLFDRFAGYDAWHTRRLLDEAARLSCEDLDRPLPDMVELLPWHKPERSLRELLERIVFTKEVWTAALGGKPMPAAKKSAGDKDPTGLTVRYENADAEFQRILRDVRNRGAWDDTFVDDLCEPPETFTFGGMFMHLITFNGYRRLTALAALRRLGIHNAGFGDPIEYESQVAPWCPEMTSTKAR